MNANLCLSVMYIFHDLIFNFDEDLLRRAKSGPPFFSNRTFENPFFSSSVFRAASTLPFLVGNSGKMVLLSEKVDDNLLNGETAAQSSLKFSLFIGFKGAHVFSQFFVHFFSTSCLLIVLSSGPCELFLFR